MNSPVVRTLLIAIVAAISSLVAAYFYPWQEAVVQSEVLGEPLFEPYGAGAVRSIRIEKFDIDRNGLDLIQLDRIGEKWVIPSRENFVATNAFQISLVTSSLNETTILEERTDEKQDHLKYGVVDPSDYADTPNRSALGTKIILEGRNRAKLASLIVGRRVGADPGQSGRPLGPGKYFVRIPGQPSVYVVDFNPAALRTDFRRWVDANLFQFNDSIPISRIAVKDSRIDSKTMNPLTRKDNYRAVFAAGQAPSVEVKSENTWKKITMIPEISERLTVIVQQMQAIGMTDAVRKKPELAKLFKSPKPDSTQTDFDSLKPYGFLFSEFNHSTYHFDSVGGELEIDFETGVSISLYIGSIAEKSSTDDLRLGHYVIMVAGVNEEAFPVPTQPLEVEDPDESEAQTRAYLRQVAAREEKIKSAHQRASELNQQYGDWIYVVPEDVIDAIRPDLPLPVSSAPSTPQPATQSPPVEKAPTPKELESKKDVPQPNSPKNDPFG